MNKQATNTLVMNEGQQAAADAFFEFLFTDEVEFDIRGPGGVGKTFLMGQLIDTVMPMYEAQCALLNIPPIYNTVEMTATTNKAAEALAKSTGRPAATIYAALNLKVSNDYKTGETKITRKRAWHAQSNKIVFIDEASMIDGPLYYQIHAALAENCKIVYVGDSKQLPPVMERVSPVYKNDIRNVTLTENVRAASQPDILALCDQMRRTVDTLDFQSIQTVPGVIDYMNEDQLAQDIAQRFSQQNIKDRILCYTNDRVRLYNDHIRNIRGLPDHVTENEILVNSASFTQKDVTLSVEQEVVLSSVSKTPYDHIFDDGETMAVRSAKLAKPNTTSSVISALIPEDMDHYRALIKWYAKQKDWSTYFQLKEGFPDLRPRDAGTVYKAQGSTYDTVIIDLGDISTSHDKQQVAHMLYVAVSRPRNRIILFGDLAPKYGKVLL